MSKPPAVNCKYSLRKAWDRAYQPWDDTEDAKMKILIKKVRSLFNKVSPITTASLTQEFLDLKVYESPVLGQVISMIFEHTIKQSKFCGLYLNMCCEQMYSELRDNNTSVFRDYLLIHMQDLFSEYFEDKEDGITTNNNEKVTNNGVTVEAQSELRRRKFECVMLIGQLFLHNLITVRVVHYYVVLLLKSVSSDCFNPHDMDEESIECAVYLLDMVGHRLHEDSVRIAAAAAVAADSGNSEHPTEFSFPFDHIVTTLTRIVDIVNMRARRMITDLVELRANEWEPKTAEHCVLRICDLNCSFCDSPKHLISAVPPPKVPHYTIDLDQIICAIYENEKISDARRVELNEVLRRLTDALQTKFIRSIFQLDVFGSTENGFGSNRSDFDVCFRYIKDGDVIDKNMLKPGTQFMTIMNIEIALRFAGFDRVTTITTAKVPIVKFTTHVGGDEIEGDISYYNELPLCNTRMLKRYCSWTKDDMLSKLGVFIKRWAKECDICDASRGSLCSYAYTILLIHFLQRLQPHPLLPVLQEMGEWKDIRVDGWDVYFCDDVPKPDWSQCTLSVGELFLKFLDYFARFDWCGQVVQIRQSNTLTKFERGWNKLMCIEDPFNRETNHGYSISKRMFTFIMRSFMLSRDVFSTFKERGIFIQHLEDAPAGDGTVARCGNALLAKCKVLVGAAPREPQCFNCGRIGHFTLKCRAAGEMCFPPNARGSISLPNVVSRPRLPIPPFMW